MKIDLRDEWPTVATALLPALLKNKTYTHTYVRALQAGASATEPTARICKSFGAFRRCF